MTTIVPMVGLTACEARTDLHPNDPTGEPLEAVCVLPAGHCGAHWARVEAWQGEPYEWHTTIPRQRKESP